MKVAFLTNFLTHHQVPFCEIMYKNLGADFHVIVMRPTATEQKQLGYKELNDVYPFVVRTYESDAEDVKAMSICEDADVVIWGSAPAKYTAKRLECNKLTLIYTERIFKKGIKHILHPAMLKYMYRKFTLQRHKNQYYLCAGAYVARDVNPFTHTPEKFLKWGYFPATKEYEDIDALIAKKKKNSIIWVARYIDWKHPEIAVEIARRLKKDGYEFELKMLGNGTMLDAITKMVEEKGLKDCVHILGGVPSDEVREHMENAEIHIFTSDRQEGWGAVLNESMNSGCAVIANKDIGAAPFLLKNSENGFLYTNVNDLYEKVVYLLNHPQKRVEISKNAYFTIMQEWNAEIATKRLLQYMGALSEKGHVSFVNGPCSAAPVLRGNSYK